MSWIQLFLANLKMLYRNWRGLFWTIVLPVGLYVGLSFLKINTGIGGVKIDYSVYLLPGMIALTIVQTGVFGLSYWLVDLKSRGILKRLQVTPMSNFEMLSSLVSTRLIVMLVQVLMLTYIGKWFFNAHVAGSVLAIIVLSVIGGAIFLCIGFLISTVSDTYDEAAPITTVLNLTFTFLGNVFFPTDILPKVFRIIGNMLPVTYLADGLRGNYLQDAGISGSWHDILALLIWLAILFALAVYMFRRTRERT